MSKSTSIEIVNSLKRWRPFLKNYANSQKLWQRLVYIICRPNHHKIFYYLNNTRTRAAKISFLHCHAHHLKRCGLEKELLNFTCLRLASDFCVNFLNAE